MAADKFFSYSPWQIVEPLETNLQGLSYDVHQ